MTYLFGKSSSHGLAIALFSLVVGLTALPVRGQQGLYNPIPLKSDAEVSDRLTTQDIPTGEGGFAKDYLVDLEQGDQVAIDLMSEEFDSVILLIGEDGTTIAENDDGPDGSTNSLLFSRITETGKYIIRVRAFGERGSGNFRLKVTRLRPVTR
ncbi:PPC domain-containing protein [Crocosphaera sp. UHCC 0190]|uniref:PPC domain-containing protein n=1 Tax=Crocosphaera sp. UHCC 0190 TaxID=3110246 RepID=UPI002B1EB905|nr:PPC domain-containing protein [Crocosphaera sp. UHCC 0190]MEA5509028.1 PPC domain-containing protein [Crocosphaera sp. UHCC 0190]